MINIAILITTFLRDKLLYETIESIINNLPENSLVLIADQGYASTEKDTNIDYYKSQIALEYYRLPFDCGLSAARNFLIQKTIEKQIPYSLMSADSIQFIASYNFLPIINFLEQDSSRGLVGFELQNSKCSWEYYIKLSEKGIHFIPSTDLIISDNVTYKKCDIVRNIYLAKTTTLQNIYDNEMKLCEHELMFLEYKKRQYQVFWTNNLIFKRIASRASLEYTSYRNRFSDYQKLLKQKLNIKKWIIYEK